TWLPGPPDCTTPQSTIHSQPAAFVPVRSTLMSAACQPVGAVVVSVAVVRSAGALLQALGVENIDTSADARAGTARQSAATRHGKRASMCERRCTLPCIGRRPAGFRRDR